MLERGRQPNIALFDFMELEFVGNVERIKHQSYRLSVLMFLWIGAIA